MRLFALPFLVACAKPVPIQETPIIKPAANYAVTPNGTTILSWRLEHSDRESIRTATSNNTRITDFEHVAHPTKDTSVVLLVELFTGRVSFSEDNETVTHTAPMKLDVRVLDHGGYRIDRVRCMGPHYQLAAPGEAPEEMMLMCDFRAWKPGANVGFTITAWGRGAIEGDRR